MKSILVTSFFLVFGLSLSAGLAMANKTMIASYTLDQTAVDRTGKNGDADLINTPFEDGGVYLNGNYFGTDPDSSRVQTPVLTDLDFSALSVKLEFKVGELPSWERPVVYCGSSWRWMGVQLNSSGDLYLTCNTVSVPTLGATVTLDTWHTLVITWDGTAGHLFFDGQEVASKVFTPNFGNDRRITSQNGGNGTNFKGHWRNLEIFNGVISRVVDASGVETPVAVRGLRNFPNPFNPSTTIAFYLETRSATTLEVYDLAGRLVTTLLNDEVLGEGPHSYLWNGTDGKGRHQPSGTYFYRFRSGGQAETRRMTLVK